MHEIYSTAKQEGHDLIVLPVFKWIWICWLLIIKYLSKHSLHYRVLLRLAKPMPNQKKKKSRLIESPNIQRKHLAVSSINVNNLLLSIAVYSNQFSSSSNQMLHIQQAKLNL